MDVRRIIGIASRVVIPALTLTAVHTLAIAAWPALAAEVLGPALREKVVTVATQVAAEPTVVEVVKSQNAKRVPVAELQRVNKAWKATRGIDDRMRALMSNSCAKGLKQMLASHPEIVAATVLDDQGAIVCMTDKMDEGYWQGNEARWKDAFKGGQGGLFIGRAHYDETDRDYVVPVSVPVMSGGRAIGVLNVEVPTR